VSVSEDIEKVSDPTMLSCTIHHGGIIRRCREEIVQWTGEGVYLEFVLGLVKAQTLSHEVQTIHH
jgi:hypothetical protein